MRITFSAHAERKFDVLAGHGFRVERTAVEATFGAPDRMSAEPGGTWIAQRGISETHVLRVVYKEQGDERFVITFYPGRRSRYEAHV